MNDQEQQKPQAAVSAINFKCAACAKKLKAVSKLAGTSIKCPACGEQTIVPAIALSGPSSGTINPASAPARKKGQLAAVSKSWIAVAVGAVVVIGAIVLFATRPSRHAASDADSVGPTFLEVPLGTSIVEGVRESGLYNPEDADGVPFRWTDGHATLVIPLNKKKLPLAVHLELFIPRPPKVAGWLQILANRREIFRQDKITEANWVKTLDLSGIDLGDELTLEIVSDSFVPKRVMHDGANTDARTLGVLVNAIELLPATDATREQLLAEDAPKEQLAKTDAPTEQNRDEKIAAKVAKNVAKARAPGVQCGSITPDGVTLVSGELDGAITIWDVATAKARARFPGVLPGLETIAVNPDGSRFAVSTPDRQIHIFDAHGQQLKLLGKHVGDITGMAYSPDGKTLAAVGGLPGNRGELKLWDVETGSERVAIAPFNLRVWSLSYAPDGQKVAVGCGDGEAHIVDAATGKVLATFNHPIRPVRQVAFSGDGALLAVAPGNAGEVLIYNVGDRKKVGVIPGLGGVITRLGFAPDVRRLRLTFFHGGTNIWDFTGTRPQFVVTLKYPAGKALFAMFVRNSETVVTGGDDGKIRLWNIKELAETAKRDAWTLGEAQTHVSQKQWVKAAEKYSRLLNDAPTSDSTVWFEYAAAQLLSGDRESYLQTCKRMLEGAPKAPKMRPYLAARACTLAPDSVNDWTLPAQTLDLEREQFGKAPWFLVVQGALKYRAKKYNDAAPLFEQSLEAQAPPGVAVLDWLWLAMTFQQMGEKEKASLWLEKGKSWLAKHRPEMPANADTFRLHRHDWLEAQVLLEEAEKLIATPLAK